MRCGIRSPRICWTRALISERCRNYWDMPRWGPPKCILIHRSSDSRRSITKRIQGHKKRMLPVIHSTTILCVRRDGKVAIGGDGQVTVGDTVMKANANKVRTLKGGKILAGFAGAAADAFTLFDKVEEKLERYPTNLPRAAVELAKDWRSDRVLRRLEALLVVADKEHGYVISGSGELIEPDDGILAIGSGGNYALAAARALVSSSDLAAHDVVQRALEIAAAICVYTNTHINILEL